MSKSRVTFTDTVGAATLQSDWPAPASRFVGWTPMTIPQGEAGHAQDTGTRAMNRTSTRYGATFRVAGLGMGAASGSALDIADRFIGHLLGGGTCHVYTEDALASEYATCGLMPGSTPSLVQSNPRLLEYTLSVALVNLAASPVAMSCYYSASGAIALDELGYTFPGAAGKSISIADVPEFDALTKATFLLWIKHNQTAAYQTVASRWQESNNTRDQWLCATDTADKLFWGQWSAAGGARAFGTGTTALVDDGIYKIAFVYDGTLSTNATKLKMYLARRTNGIFAALAQDTVAFSGASIPSLLSTPISATVMHLGKTVSDVSPFAGGLIAARLYLGSALTSTQLEAEHPFYAPTTASLRYNLDTGATNTGSVSGYNGTVASGVTLGSIVE